MVNSSVPPPNTPLVGNDGRISNEWYRYFVGLTATADGASSGEVATNPGSGLAGGGAVSAGISISIDDNGVTNGKFRQSTGNSVVGRTASSTGNVADIVAALNDTTLVRQGNQVFFSQDINTRALVCTTLRVNTADAVSTATTTHSVPVSINGNVRYLLLSNVP